jgi:hypothetical protein
MRAIGDTRRRLGPRSLARKPAKVAAVALATSPLAASGR